MEGERGLPVDNQGGGGGGASLGPLHSRGGRGGGGASPLPQSYSSSFITTLVQIDARCEGMDVVVVVIVVMAVGRWLMLLLLFYHRCVS